MTGNIATEKYTEKCTSVHAPAADGRQSVLAAVLERLTLEVREGIRHGHFKCQVVARDGSGGCTEVVIEAGKSYRFHVPRK